MTGNNGGGNSLRDLPWKHLPLGALCIVILVICLFYNDRTAARYETGMSRQHDVMQALGSNMLTIKDALANLTRTAEMNATNSARNNENILRVTVVIDRLLEQVQKIPIRGESKRETP